MPLIASYGIVDHRATAARICRRPRPEASGEPSPGVTQGASGPMPTRVEVNK
jgi:hypothetical protein